MLIEAVTKRDKDNFRCYFEFAELEDTPNSYIVKVVNTLSKNKMFYIRKTFFKRDAVHSHKRHGIICNFNPFKFIKEEFDVITTYSNYHYLDNIKHMPILCDLYDKELIENNCIFEGERKYKSDCEPKTVYYLNSTPEIDDIIISHMEKKSES